MTNCSPAVPVTPSQRRNGVSPSRCPRALPWIDLKELDQLFPATERHEASPIRSYLVTRAEAVEVTGRYSNRQIAQIAAGLLDWALEARG
jgi:hypothetical protein